MTTREFYLISECYTNPNFSAEVYLEMMNQYPNSIMTYNEFCNMINNIFDNYYNEEENKIAVLASNVKNKISDKIANNKINNVNKKNFKMANKMTSTKRSNAYVNKVLNGANNIY